MASSDSGGRTSPIGGTPAELLRKRMETDLRTAMKMCDAIRVSALRSLIGALDNASAVEQTSEHVPVHGRSGDVPRREVSREEIASIVRREIAERESSAVDYERLGYRGKADELRAGVAMLQQYLSPEADAE